MTQPPQSPEETKSSGHKLDRIAAMRKLEAKRGSKIIAFVTGDRPNLVTQIGDDSVRLIHEHLSLLGPQRMISLFLYTRGGVLMAPQRIVQLIREYAKTFEVIVPYRAHSAGTLICLGADKIVMAKLGELTPVDPSTANDFNPQNPLNPAVRIPISVEDVIAYLALAKNQAELTSESTRLEVFRALTSQVNVIALGNVRRVYNEIRSLVDSLLRLHMTTEKEKGKIPSILKTLTETYTHEHPISRTEAQRIGLKAEIPDDSLESMIMDLYGIYEKDLLLRDPFNPDSLMGTKPSVQFSYETAYVESTARTHAFIQGGTISKSQATLQLQGAPNPIPVPGLDQVTIKLTTQKWQEIP